MGAWAADPFGNDTACDWKHDVEKTTGYQFIEETLESVTTSGDDYLDSFEDQRAVAAADTVARLRGHFYVRDSFTKSLDEWVAKQTVEVPPDLVELAIAAVDRVLSGPSESLDLWEESGDFEEWKSQMEALKERLRKPPQH
jgi:hypothetical protein